MTTDGKSTILKDVVAYVDVWSADKTANYSKPFIQQLEQMGAKVSKTFNKEVTHVIFNNGHLATWRKAKKNNVRLVSLLWISRCNDDGVQVNEELFPALNDESNPVVKNKKHRCMRPKDSVERTPDSDRRMKKKLDKMLKVFSPKEPVCTDVSSVFIDEENGIVYSPALKRSEYMAQRLKDMKEKRENLSPTSSQILGSDVPAELRISTGSAPEVLKLMFENSEDEDLPTTTLKLNCSLKEEREDLDLHSNYPEWSFITNSTKPSVSPCRDVPNLNNIDLIESPDVGEKKANAKKPRSTTPREKQQDKPFSDSPCLNRRSGVSKRLNKETRAQIQPYDLLLNTSGKQKNLVGKSVTETKSIFYTEPEDTSCYPPLSTQEESSAAETSKGAAALIQNVGLKTPKQASSSLSSLVRSVTQSKEAEVAPIIGDDNDDVFEDYFFPANHRQRSKEHSLPNLCSRKTIHIPFDLAPAQKKRKQRKSETLGLERHDDKKRKVDQRQSGKSHNQQLGTGSLLEIRQEDFQDLPHLNLIAKESLEAETPSEGSLGMKMVTNPTQKPLKRQCEPTPAQPALLTEEEAGSILLKNSVRNDSHDAQNFGYEHRLPTGFSAMPSDVERLTDSSKPQNMPHKSKAGRTLVMTSMPTEKQSIVFQVVTALGGFLVVDRVCESTTHVVSGGHKRTLNILLGIARGCWILSFEWILWCLEQRQWISEEPYELSDQFPAAQICRLQRHLSAGEHQQDLFQGQPAMFVSQHSQPPTHSLVELIELCGGTVSRNVRQSNICIGKYDGRRPEGSRILSEQWVLDSITQLKLLPYENYNLE